MNKSRYGFCALIAAMLICPTDAAYSEWQIVEAAYVPMPYPIPTFGVVCSGYDSSVCANVGNLYRFNHQTLQRFTLVGAFANNWGLRLSLTTGAQATKVLIDPRLQIGVIRSIPLASGRALSAEVYGSIGGDMKNKPCLDSYDREYFCGSLTAWSDYPNKQISFPEYGFKVLYRF